MSVSSFSRLFLISCVARNSIAQAFTSLQHHQIMRHSRPSSSAVAATTTSSPHDDTNVFRILCLHGKGGNGEEFLKRLLPLRALLDNSLANENERKSDVSNVSIQWEALTAPYKISDTDDAYAWWTMAPGVRSFNADDYIGFDESASNVMSAVLSSKSDSSTTTTTSPTEYNYDLILGHSQGAILLAALLATNIDLQRSNCSYILNGAAWPNPYKKALKSISEQTDHDVLKEETKMLFVMGKNDTINPIESAKQVHDCYQTAGLDVSLTYHEGGHSVPNGRDLDSERALEEICNFILQAVSEKSKRIVARDGI